MKYETPICEILKFGKEDILTTSPAKELGTTDWGSSLSNLNIGGDM